MARSRLNRLFVVLALLLAQAALGLPLAGTVGVARAQTAEAMIAHTGGGPMADAMPMAHGATPPGARPVAHDSHGAGDCHRPGVPQHTPTLPCGSCPDMPEGPTGAGCPAMAGCTASPASPSAVTPVAPATVALVDAPPSGLLPAAHDFNPDPPPPRA